MDAVTYREAAQAAARDLARTVPDATCTLVVCGPPPYRHTLTAIVPDLPAAAAVVEAMDGSTWTGTDGTWRGLSVGLVVEDQTPPGCHAGEETSWWRREHTARPDVRPERAAEAIATVRRMEQVGAL